MAGTSFFVFFFKASCCYSSVHSAEMYCLQYAINELLNALNESHSKCNCLCSPEAHGQAWRRSCQWNRAVFNLHLMTFTHIHKPCYNLTQESRLGVGGDGYVSRVESGVFMDVCLRVCVFVWKRIRERQSELSEGKLQCFRQTYFCQSYPSCFSHSFLCLKERLIMKLSTPLRLCQHWYILVLKQHFKTKRISVQMSVFGLSGTICVNTNIPENTYNKTIHVYQSCACQCKQEADCLFWRWLLSCVTQIIARLLQM